MFEYDPVTSLRHWPTPMQKYGKNPFGEPLYRIVFRDSRRHLVGGTWPDGATGYHWVPKYREVQAPWILERWYASHEFTKMSQAQWDLTMVDPVSGWLILGPYPSRGEYDMVWEFHPGDNLDQVIAAVERGRDRSFTEVRDAHHAEYQQEQKTARADRFHELRDAQTAFGGDALSAGRFGRGTKTTPNLLSAEELGLPIPKAGRLRNPSDLRGLDVTSTLTAGR